MPNSLDHEGQNWRVKFFCFSFPAETFYLCRVPCDLERRQIDTVANLIKNMFQANFENIFIWQPGDRCMPIVAHSRRSWKYAGHPSNVRHNQFFPGCLARP